VSQATSSRTFLVMTGSYEDVRPLASFEDKAQAARWARRWERRNRHLAEDLRTTFLWEISHTPAGARGPRPVREP
jgi:hypothetical protein